MHERPTGTATRIIRVASGIQRVMGSVSVLDQIIEGVSLFTRLTGWSLIVMFAALIGGILLRKGDS